jgi:hypothetical protein
MARLEVPVNKQLNYGSCTTTTSDAMPGALEASSFELARLPRPEVPDTISATSASSIFDAPSMDFTDVPRLVVYMRQLTPNPASRATNSTSATTTPPDDVLLPSLAGLGAGEAPWLLAVADTTTVTEEI